MTYFYDSNEDKLLTNGIDIIPDNAIEITEENYLSIIDGKMNGQKVIVKNNTVILQPLKPSDEHEWDGQGWAIVKREDEIAMMRGKINALRDEKSAGGVYVEPLGKWFDSDSKAQAKLLGLKATIDLVGSDMTVSWTCADNTEFENFGKSQLTAVIAAISQTENHNHTVARRHKAALEQSDNPLEYDYSSGWAKTYQEYLEEQR